MKGYGLKGLKGIMPISGRRIHPLLALSRKQIEGYALDQGLKWVEDSSNIKLNYLRNSVRWKLLPEMREINYQIDFLLLSLAEQASEMDRWLNCTVIELEQKGVWKKQKDTIILDIDIFLTYFIILRNYILRYILRQLTPDYHLSPARLEEITQLCLCETGRKIIFGPVEIVKDRNFLIFFVPKRTHIEQELDTHGYFNGDGWCLELKPYLISKVKYVSNREIEYIDEEKICRKLKLRNWRPGDRFIPLGMKGLVKVSDYLINEKLSRYEKERQLVLCDEEKIIWICGKRIDERVKVTQFTNKVLRMTYKLHA
jgi:tRNA(Ile)-lysidine synthase